MELKKISDKIFYCSHQAQTDRPMLAYIKGEKFALAVDAGNSAAHVDEFYSALAQSGLKKPNFTAITHWHWDHTFGMHRISGLSVAHNKTNALLNIEKEKSADSAYTQISKNDNVYLKAEYTGDKKIVITSADIMFEKELTFDLGGITAKVFHTVAPHSVDTTLIYIPEEKVLFLGDSTSGDYYNNNYMDKNKLNALISTIESIDCEYCVVSHAEPQTKHALLQYLKSI